MTIPQEEEELRGAQQEQATFEFVVEDAKRYFGQWDPYDPVVWALLRIVEAQNDFSRAIILHECEGVGAHVLEAAIAERIEAIAALQQAIKEEPRGFQ
jgi:hypothetical protein